MTQGLSEAALQKEIFLLRDREYPYYRQSNFAALPAVPDLSDSSGGLSNPTFFNFVYYILWKVNGSLGPEESCDPSAGSD